MEALAVDGPIEQAGRVDARSLRRAARKVAGLPAAVRNLVDEALFLQRPAAQAGHVGLRPGFIDGTPGACRTADEALIGSPPFAVAADVWAILLARDEGLFLNVTPIRRKESGSSSKWYVVGFDGSLGQKAIAKRLKRDGPASPARSFEKNHGAASAWKPRLRAVSDRLFASRPVQIAQAVVTGIRHRSADLVASRGAAAAHFPPLHR